MRTARYLAFAYLYLAALRTAWPFVLIVTLGVVLCAPRRGGR